MFIHPSALDRLLADSQGLSVAYISARFQVLPVWTRVAQCATEQYVMQRSAHHTPVLDVIDDKPCLLI